MRPSPWLPAVTAAHKRVIQHLSTIDPKSRRVDMALGIAASLSVNLLLLAVGLIALSAALPV